VPQNPPVDYSLPTEDLCQDILYIAHANETYTFHSIAGNLHSLSTPSFSLLVALVVSLDVQQISVTQLKLVVR
jgi:hypothetical protein